MSETVVIQSMRKDKKGVKISDVWYNAKPADLDGLAWKDTVEVEVDGKDLVSIKKVGGEEKTPYKKKGGGFPPADPNRQATIVYQSSRKDAIQVAVSLLAADILPFPAAKGKKHDAFMAYVDQLTDHYHVEAMHMQQEGKLPTRAEQE